MGIAGLAVQPSRAVGIAKDIAAINKAMNVTNEIKWESAQRRRSDVHRAYVDLLAKLIEHRQVHLHMRFCPINRYDHRASGPRRHADTVSKAFYQLLLHRAARYYARRCAIHVRPDNGSCTSYLPNMLAGLNTDASLKFSAPENAFRTIQPCDSLSEPLLQLLDVTLGALTCSRNGNHMNGNVGPYKAELASYATQALGLSDLAKSDDINRRFLNVWNVTPKWEKGAAPKR